MIYVWSYWVRGFVCSRAVYPLNKSVENVSECVHYLQYIIVIKHVVPILCASLANSGRNPVEVVSFLCHAAEFG